LHALLSPLLAPRLRGEAAALLGGEIRLEPGPFALLDAPDALASLARPPCALLLQEQASARREPLACELPVELAARLIDRVLGGDGEAAHPLGQPLDDLSAGVLGFLAGRLCAAAGAPVRVSELLDDAQRCAATLGDAPWLCLPARLLIDGRAYGSLRVLVPERTARLLAARAAPASALHADDAPLATTLSLRAIAARTSLSRAQLRELSTGDVLVPERCALQRASDGWTGHVELHAPDLAIRFHAAIRGRELVIERREPRQEPEMTEAKRIATAALSPTSSCPPLGDDTPIELCLELARFTLPLGELAALRPGDVLDTGRSAGSHVTLTAAGRVVALGELVEVDGDVGLRVLELRRAARDGER
jgi:type III secretion system YscQ/HrcQ family protein